MPQLTVTAHAATTGELLDALAAAAAAIRSGNGPGNGPGWSYQVHADDIDAAAAATRTCEEAEVLLAAHQLAQLVRAAYPHAADLVLDDSDQGDWAVFAGVADADGDELYDVAVHACLDGAADDLACHLYSRRAYLLHPHLAPGQVPDRRNPLQLTLSLDSLLATDAERAVTS